MKSNNFRIKFNQLTFLILVFAIFGFQSCKNKAESKEKEILSLEKLSWTKKVSQHGLKENVNL